MKRLLVMMAAAVVLTGCVTNDSWNDGEQSEIKMAAIGKVANRAIVEGANVPDDFDFTVFGFYTTNSFAATSQFAMWNVKCSKQGSYFKHDTDSYYWPWTGEVGFYAVSPASVEPSVAWASGVTLVDYTVLGAESNDLMFAYNKGSNQAAALNMVFHHALAQVEVALNTDKAYDDVTLAVTGISFENIDTTASCVYKESSPADQTSNPSISWSGNTDYASTEVYSSTTQAVTYNEVDGVATPVTYGDGVVVIPQTMDATSEIAIGYALTQNGKTIAGVVKRPITTTWVQGNKYIYTLTFSLNEILFNPSATDWVKVDSDSISIE